MPARSFRLVSFCFEGFCLETDSYKVFHCQLEPKDAELRPRLAQEKDRVLRALFFTSPHVGPNQEELAEPGNLAGRECRVRLRQIWLMSNQCGLLLEVTDLQLKTYEAAGPACPF